MKIYTSAYTCTCIYTCIYTCTLMRDARRKEEGSKQGQTNNKAKQHSTPKAVTFPKKNELTQVGLEPTTLYTLDRVLYQMYMLMRDEEGKKKETSKVKQTTNKAKKHHTHHTHTPHTHTHRTCTHTPHTPHTHTTHTHHTHTHTTYTRTLTHSPATHSIGHVEWRDLPRSLVAGREVETAKSHTLILLGAWRSGEVRDLLDTSQCI